jgi:transcription elongation factor GreA
MAESMSATEAVSHFLASVDPDKARDERPEIDRFIASIGADLPMSSLTGVHVAAFAEAEGESGETLEPVRAFLAYSARMAFTATNLVGHLHIGENASGITLDSPDAYGVTIEGLALLESTVEELKARRPEIADMLRIAMADKDFRENAPLDAARDEQAHLEARIREIEDQLRRAVIIDEESKAGLANVGSMVKTRNLESEAEMTFKLVSPAEVDAGSGKISIESPFGSAVINHGPGDEVTVKTPGGLIRLRVLEVEG